MRPTVEVDRSTGGADLIVRVVRGSADELVRAHVRLQFPEVSSDDPRYEVAIQFVVGALMGVLVWWLDSEAPQSAEEMHDAFQRLATRGVRPIPIKLIVR